MNNTKYPSNIFLLVASSGLVLFLIISSTLSFKDAIFQLFFPKPRSQAQEIEATQRVGLKIFYKNKMNDGILNVAQKEQGISLIWNTPENTTDCVGKSWGISSTDQTWDGPKNPKGGSFELRPLDKNNPYVYTIICSNSQGMLGSDAVTINVGAQKQILAPYIVNFEVIINGQKYLTFPREVALGDKININWSSLNTTTPYSICVASGSINKNYKNSLNFQVSEELSINEKKIYGYALFCSNEYSFSKQESIFIPI